MIKILLILVLILGAASFIFLNKDSFKIPTSQKSSSPTITSTNRETLKTENINYALGKFDILPESTTQSYPAVKDKNLILIQIKDGQQINTNINFQGYGGAAFLGSTSPQAAPDLKKTAFIEKNRLGIITGDGKNKVLLPENLEVEYISGWAPDSERLIVYSERNDIARLYEGQGGAQYADSSISFPKQALPTGFYLVDVKKGTFTYLYPMSKFAGWIDSNRVLHALSQTNYEEYSIFNVDTFTVDVKTLLGKFDKYFSVHFSFSKDGKKWATSKGSIKNENRPDYSDVVIGNFPETDGQKIVQGVWAQYQGPIISPEGDKVIITQGRGGDGWDMALWKNNQLKNLASHYTKAQWIDNNSFIYETSQSNPKSSTNKIYLYNISTDKSTQLFESETKY